MALTLSTLRKPVNRQVIDPTTGQIREEWELFFGYLTTQLNGAVGELGVDFGPADATYIVGATNSTLTAERVATNSTSNTWNLSTPGQATVERAALTGDVTASANSNATTIANDVVTFAKMQNITSDRLIGRDTASGGDPEEISVGGGLEFTGSAGIRRSALTGDVSASAGSNSTTIQNDAVSDAKLRDSAALSVIGRSANSSGDPADIAAANDGEVLRRSGTSLGFGTVATACIADDAVTYAKIQDVTASSRVLGRVSSGSGVVEEVTPAQLLGILGPHVIFDGTSAANLTGTYSRSGTTVTCTVTGHGHLVGHRVYLDFTTGTATDGSFTVTTVADADTFTITHGTSGATSGNVSLLRRTITVSSGVQSVVYQATAGSYIVNFSSAFADANYHTLGSAGTTDADSTLSPDTSNLTTLHCEIAVRDNSAAALEDSPRVSMIFLPTA